MSRVSQASMEKRHVASQLGIGKGQMTKDAGISHFVTPDGAVAANLHSVITVVYEPLYEAAPQEGHSIHTSGSTLTNRRQVEDQYDRDLDRAEVEEDEQASLASARRSPRSARSGRNSARSSDSYSDSESGGNTPRTEALGGSPTWTGKGEKLENNCERYLIHELWSAEQDGTVSVRDPSTGRHVPNGTNRLRRFPETFVTALLQVQSTVYAGYEDGTIRAFSVYTKEVVWEKKKHTGMINSMVLWKNSFMFTASGDFRIICWQVGEERAARVAAAAAKEAQLARDREQANREKLGEAFAKTAQQRHLDEKLAQQAAVHEPAVFLQELSGHANRVRCLCISGDFIFSGGDDGKVRCWDVHLHAEVSGRGVSRQRNMTAETSLISANGTAGPSTIRTELAPYPLSAHADTVRDIAIVDQYLLTAGTGGVAIWDQTTAQLLHTFPFEEVNCIHVDTTSLQLWAASTKDGTVTVIDLYSFETLGVIDDFGNANIKSVTATTSSIASRLFLVSPSAGLTTVYVETGGSGMPRYYNAVAAVTRSLTEQLDQSRESLLSSERVVQESRRLLWYLRDVDRYRTDYGTKLLENGKNEELESEYHCRSAIFLGKSRFRDRCLQLAGELQTSNNLRLMFSTIIKWHQLRRWSKDGWFRDHVEHSLQNSTNRLLVTNQLRNALKWTEKMQRRKRDFAAADILAKTTLRKQFGSLWVRWLRGVASKGRATTLSKMLRMMNERQNLFLRHLSYNKMYRYFGRVQSVRMRSHVSNIMERKVTDEVAKKFFSLWKRFSRTNKLSRQVGGAVDTMAANADRKLASRYFFKLRSNLRVASFKRVTERKEDLEGEMSQMQKLILTPSQYSEADLDKQIEELEQQLVDADHVARESRASLNALEDRESTLLLQNGLPENQAVLTRRAEATASKGPGETAEEKEVRELRPKADHFRRYMAAMTLLSDTDGINIPVQFSTIKHYYEAFGPDPLKSSIVSTMGDRRKTVTGRPIKKKGKKGKKGLRSGSKGKGKGAKSRSASAGKRGKSASKVTAGRRSTSGSAARGSRSGSKALSAGKKASAAGKKPSAAGKKPSAAGKSPSISQRRKSSSSSPSQRNSQSHHRASKAGAPGALHGSAPQAKTVEDEMRMQKEEAAREEAAKNAPSTPEPEEKPTTLVAPLGGGPGVPAFSFDAASAPFGASGASPAGPEGSQPPASPQRPTESYTYTVALARSGFQHFAEDEQILTAGPVAWPINLSKLAESDLDEVNSALTGVRESIIAWSYVKNTAQGVKKDGAGGTSSTTSTPRNRDQYYTGPIQTGPYVPKRPKVSSRLPFAEEYYHSGVVGADEMVANVEVLLRALKHGEDYDNPQLAEESKGILGNTEDVSDAAHAMQVALGEAADEELKHRKHSHRHQRAGSKDKRSSSKGKGKKSRSSSGGKKTKKVTKTKRSSSKSSSKKKSSTVEEPVDF